MAVYVDALQYHPPKSRDARRYGVHWCHMWADTEAELHAFAGSIGMRRSWFQPHDRLPHYDLTPARRTKAVAAGAVQTSPREWLRIQGCEARTPS